MLLDRLLGRVSSRLVAGTRLYLGLLAMTSDLASAGALAIQPREPEGGSPSYPMPWGRVALGVLGISPCFCCSGSSPASEACRSVLLPPLRAIWLVANGLDRASASACAAAIGATCWPDGGQLHRHGRGVGHRARRHDQLVGLSPMPCDHALVARYLPPAIGGTCGRFCSSAKSEATVLVGHRRLRRLLWPILLATVDGVRGRRSAADPLPPGSIGYRRRRHRRCTSCCRWPLPQIVVGLRLAVSPACWRPVVGEMLGGTDGPRLPAS